MTQEAGDATSVTLDQRQVRAPDGVHDVDMHGHGEGAFGHLDLPAVTVMAPV